MKHLLPERTTGQIAAIVILALLAPHALSAAVWLTFDMRPGPPPMFMRPAAQIGLLARMLVVLPMADHPAIIAVAASGAVAVREGVDRIPVLSPAGAPDAGGFAHALREEPSLAGQTWSLGRQAGPDAPLAVLVTGANRWMLFEPAPGNFWQGAPLRWLSPSAVASAVAIPVLLIVISLWAARRVTSPLVRLAAATEGMSVSRDPPPLIEEGAREVRQVARALNTMSERLRGIVTDRTRTLAAISHDLRTPLTRLKLRAEQMTDQETSMKMLKDIRAMESMITSVLAFMREEGAQEAIQKVDLAVLLHTVCDDFSDAGHEVRYEGPLHCAALCRPQALQRALNNIVDNAVRFGTVVAGLEVAATALVITVDDDGPGIPDEQREAVFQPFFRGETDRETQHDGGVGLGLSIVRAIVQSHGGQVELANRAPNGLRVRLALPRQQVSRHSAGPQAKA